MQFLHLWSGFTSQERFGMGSTEGRGLMGNFAWMPLHQDGVQKGHFWLATNLWNESESQSEQAFRKMVTIEWSRELGPSLLWAPRDVPFSVTKKIEAKENRAKEMPALIIYFSANKTSSLRAERSPRHLIFQFKCYSAVSAPLTGTLNTEIETN